MNNPEQLQDNNAREQKNEPTLEDKEKVLNVAEEELEVLDKKLLEDPATESITDPELKAQFNTEKKTLQERLNVLRSEFIKKVGALLGREKQTLSPESEALYESYLETNKEKLVADRIFYKGQNLEDTREQMWTKELQSHKDSIFGKVGRTGDYLEKIASLDPESPLCQLATRMHKTGLINDTRLYVGDAPSGYSGYFININSAPFSIASGKKQLKSKEAYLKKYIEYKGAEHYFVQTLLHEGIHALLLKRINSPKTSEDRLFADKIYTIFNEVKNSVPEWKKKQYGFTDVDEFLAEFLTDGEFRNTVSGVIIDRQKLDKNYFENFEPKDFFRIKIRNILETVLRTENPADTTQLAGKSEEILRQTLQEMLGEDLVVDNLNASLETQSIIDLAKRETIK
jgi:hypothetical protein